MHDVIRINALKQVSCRTSVKTHLLHEPLNQLSCGASQFYYYVRFDNVEKLQINVILNQIETSEANKVYRLHA